MVIYVQLNGFGTVGRFFVNDHVKTLLITEPSRATPLISVRLAKDSFEDKIILFLSLDGLLENQNR